MFTYISTLSTLVPTWTQKLASFFNLSPDKTQAAIKLFQNLNIIVNSTNEDNKKYLFQELAKDADINDIMYVYAATYIKATNVMYHDAVLGYLILNAFWIDGSVVGVNKINKAAPGLYHKTVADWKGSLNKFTTYSAALIQETYKSLESDLQLKDTTIYKPNRFKQTYGAPTAEIQMMVTINEKFNYNCDGDYNNSKYRKGIALAYKSFKITTPK